MIRRGCPAAILGHNSPEAVMGWQRSDTGYLAAAIGIGALLGLAVGIVREVWR